MSTDNGTHFNITDTITFNSAIDHIIELLNNSGSVAKFYLTDYLV